MEIEELQGKISALDKSSKLLDQKFVSLVKKSEKCNNMLEIISDNIQGEDDNNRQVWVPKKCVQRIKAKILNQTLFFYSLVGLYSYCH